MKNINRWFYAGAGVLVLLFAGIIYAWSILSLPIAGEFPEWSRFQLSVTFTIAMSFFCLGGLLGGLMVGRGINVRVNITLSSLLTLTGFLLAAAAGTPLQLYLGFGVLAGLGSGFAYNGVLSTMSQWFPDRQGLISGVLLMGFGLGSFLIGKVYQTIVPELAGTWRTAFRFLGVFIGGITLLSLPFFVRPDPSRLPAGTNPKTADREYRPGEMLKTPSFYFYYLWATLLSAAGLVLVSQASGILNEVSPQVQPGLAATVVGLISVCNGGGRVLFGLLYDRKGYRFVMRLVIAGFLITAGVLLAAIWLKAFPLVVVGFILGGCSYGGVTPTNSALTNDFYGAKHYAVNFSMVGTNLILASFGSSIAGALYDRSGSFFSSIILIVITALLGLICLTVLCRPGRDQASGQTTNPEVSNIWQSEGCANGKSRNPQAFENGLAIGRAERGGE